MKINLVPTPLPTNIVSGPNIDSSKPMNLQLGVSCSLEEKRSEDQEWKVDPSNAHNWSAPKKWTAVAIVSLYATIPVFALSIIATALSEIAKQFHVHNPTITALILSVTLLTYIFGPLVLVPLSEMYGRVWILNFCSILSVAFNLGCAFSPNVGTLIAFRALYGFVANAPHEIAVGVVSDIFPPKHRATPVAIYYIGSLIGPFIGSVVGGYMAQTTSSEWIFVVIAALFGGTTVLGLILLRETYAPVIRMRQAKSENNIERAARAHPLLLDPHQDVRTLIRINLTRPLVLLFHSLICFMLSILGGILNGIFFIVYTGFPDLFGQTYGFKPGAIGLAYSGFSIGFTLSMIVGGKWADYVYNHLVDKNGGKAKPEMRMPCIIPGSILVCIGLLWYGWCAQAKLHWVMPIIGSAIFGFGFMTAILAITLYLTDAFTYAASALAAASVFRSIFAFAFPLFGKQMYHALGQGWGNSLLAGFAILFGIPFPILIYYKGEDIRSKSPSAISVANA